MITRIIELLRHQSGLDFSAYRAPTLERRIRNRMISVGASDLAEYSRVLAESAHEVRQLIERITIKVSRFYRDPITFDLLRNSIIPSLAATRRPLRLWSAGCARGEEAYTLAMLLQEAGAEGTVLATDIDPAALDTAGQGLYRGDQAERLPRRLFERYLEPVEVKAGLHYRVHGGIRARVQFALHDVSSQQGSEVFDLVCCRNVLIYWAPPLQQTMLERLCAALADGGYLCLGEADWAHGATTRLLRPVPGSNQVFRKECP
jgi:chemotaxis methyl-accepting protein methylase